MIGAATGPAAASRSAGRRRRHGRCARCGVAARGRRERWARGGGTGGASRAPRRTQSRSPNELPVDRERHTDSPCCSASGSRDDARRTTATGAHQGLDSEGSHRPERQAQRGHARAHPARHLRAVEGDHRDVTGDGETVLGQRLVDAHGDPVVEADQGAGPRTRAQPGVHRVVRRPHAPRARHDAGKGHPGLGQSRRDAGHPVTPGGRLGRRVLPHHVHRTGEARSEQVLDGLLSPQAVIGQHGGQVTLRIDAVQQDRTHVAQLLGHRHEGRGERGVDDAVHLPFRPSPRSAAPPRHGPPSTHRSRAGGRTPARPRWPR